MKKRVLAIMLVAAALFAAASIFAACDFVGTVPDYYYSYEVDLTQEDGRELYDRYGGAAVYAKVTRYEEDRTTVYRQYSFNSAGVYVTEDGWLALPAAAFVPTSFFSEVDRYSVRIYYSAEEDGETVTRYEQFYFYGTPYGDNAPIDGNIYVDEEYGVAIVKVPVEGRTNKYIPVTGNTGIASLGEKLWLFSVMGDLQEPSGSGLISSVLLAGSDVRMYSGSHSFDYVTTRSRAEYLLDGCFHSGDIGGVAVNKDGQAVGIIFSRIYSDSGADQENDIYGKACMTDITHVVELLEQAAGGNDAQ